MPLVAHAIPVTYEFGGTIVGVSVSATEGFSSGAALGDVFSGSFTYDDSVATNGCGGLSCGYVDFVTALTYTMAGQTFTFNPLGNSDGENASHGAVQMQCGGPSCVPFQVFGLSAGIGALPGDSPSWNRVASFVVGSTNMSTFAAYDRLPSVIGPLSAFDHLFNIDGALAGPLFEASIYSAGVPLNGYGPSYARAVGQITSLQPIPEPSTYALMLAGLGAVAYAARRRRAATV